MGAQSGWVIFQERRHMSIENPLFQGRSIRLEPMDHEKDAAIVSGWTHDFEFMRMMYTEPAYPLSPWQVKKSMDEMEKSIEEGKNIFHFRIHTLQDDRLIGFVELTWISWTNAQGFIRLGIGESEYRRKGYGSEALAMILRYAFDELNLYRLTANIPEYNAVAEHLFQRFGFIEEVRRRQAIERDARRWDLIHYGLLAREWKERQK
jgi:RimJ/RimL family protein N-acetyltransferase